MWRYFHRNEDFAQIRRGDRDVQREWREREWNRAFKESGRAFTKGKLALNGLMKKWKTPTYDPGGLRELEYIAPLEKEGERVVILDRREPQPPVYRDLLRISTKVLGDPPAMRVITCMIIHKWNIQSKFQIVRYKGSTFTATFMETGLSETLWLVMGYASQHPY